MARTYSKLPVISSVKVGGQQYWLKDADVRAILNAIDDSYFTAFGTAVDTADAALTTKKYVDDAIGAVAHLKLEVVQTLPTTDIKTDVIYLVPKGEGKTGYREWVRVNDAWEEIGDTDIDLTDYLDKTATVAGVAFGDDKAITVAELEAESALNLKALAHKDAAAGTVTLTDYVTGAEAVSVTAEGTVTVGSTVTATAATFSGSYTPEGSITGSAISGGSISVTLDAGTATEADLDTADYTPAGDVTITKSESGSFQVSGEVSAPTITITSAPQAVLTGVASEGATPSFTDGVIGTFTAPELQDGFVSAGTAPSWTGATFTAPSLSAATTSLFATAGVTAEMDTDDAECLVLAAAGTAAAITDRGTFSAGSVDFGTFEAGSVTTIDTTKFAPGSWVAGTFNAGSMPTFSDGSVNNVTGATADAPVFTGDKFTPSFSGTVESDLKVTGVSYLLKDIATAAFNPEAATLGFSGTAATINTSGEYDKVSVTDATFTGTPVSATVTLTTDTKSVEVSVS